MIGGGATRAQKAAYRAVFSVERIGNELWILIFLAWSTLFFVALDLLGGSWLLIVAFVTSLLALYGLTWRFLVPWVEDTMPAELRAALPRDRFAGPSSPNAPRTYAELFRRWRTHGRAE